MILSICIVNYNTADLTTTCIRSILEFTRDIDYEIIVVDNASSDNSASIITKEFGGRITLLKNPTNRFFTGGFNDAFFRCRGKYTLVLNSDTRLVDNSLKVMTDFMESHPDTGAVEGTIIDEVTGAVTPTSSKELTIYRERIRSIKVLKRLLKPLYNEYSYSGWDRLSDREVEVVCDAFMMVRTDLLRKVGGYNEALKLYFTEEYLSDIIRMQGYRLWHLGGAKVFHIWNSSTKKVRKKFINAVYVADRIVYFALKGS
jgi:N-acetylglucosaminyl-diphospho-decaprenol L-rhamnosyltransferase